MENSENFDANELIEVPLIRSIVSIITGKLYNIKLKMTKILKIQNA